MPDKRKIIVLNGVARSGKDTFAQEVGRLWKERFRSNFRIYSTVDTIKTMFEEHWGIEEDPKTDAKRKLWCETKKLLTEYNDCILKEIEQMLANFSFYWGTEKQPSLFIIMAREPEEIDRIKKAYPETSTVLIMRNVDIPNNSADRGVEDYFYDFVINGNGTVEDLKELARCLMNIIEIGYGKDDSKREDEEDGISGV